MFPLPNTDSALIGPLFILFCALKATLQKKPIRDRKFPTREHRLLLDKMVPIPKKKPLIIIRNFFLSVKVKMASTYAYANLYMALNGFLCSSLHHSKKSSKWLAGGEMKGLLPSEIGEF